MSGDHFLNLQPGTVINGRYEVVKCLGTGSMGMVYACRHRELAGHIVAMKVLFSEVARDEVAAARFRNEIVASYGVSHPNVVRAYEYFRDGDLIAYTMEYVNGGDLADKISNQEVISIPEIVRMLSQMCGGVQAIHEAAIVHRDLKPENILLTTGGDVKITDFGIARMHSGPKLTDHGGVVGTIDYVCPEYLEQGQVDSRSDIYALGVLAYEMITHEPPFKGKSVVESMTMRLKSDPVPPSKHREDCPKGLSNIVLKAMARDPQLRYQSAREMLDDLNILQKQLDGTGSGDSYETIGVGPTLDDILSPAEAVARARADTAELQHQPVPRERSSIIRPQVFSAERNRDKPLKPDDEQTSIALALGGGGGSVSVERGGASSFQRTAPSFEDLIDSGENGDHDSGTGDFRRRKPTSPSGSSFPLWGDDQEDDGLRPSIAISESHLPSDRLRELTDNIQLKKAGFFSSVLQLLVIGAFGFGVGYFLWHNFEGSEPAPNPGTLEMAPPLPVPPVPQAGRSR